MSKNKDILELVKNNEIKTLQELLSLLKKSISEYQKAYPEKIRNTVKNEIITNLLKWVMKDPRRTTFAKFYLECFDRLFFIDKGLSNDNDGVILNFINEGDIKIENS